VDGRSLGSRVWLRLAFQSFCYWAVDRLVSRWLGRSFGWFVRSFVRSFVGWSVGRSVGRLIGWLFRSFFSLSVGHFPLVSLLIGRSFDPLFGWFANYLMFPYSHMPRPPYYLRSAPPALGNSAACAAPLCVLARGVPHLFTRAAVSSSLLYGSRQSAVSGPLQLLTDVGQLMT
jgi:hypothetical protein